MATLGQASGKTYLTVINGQFAQKVGEGTEGAEKRTNKNGKVVYEKYYKTAEGIITSMEIRTSDYDGRTFKTMCITLDDEIQLQFTGGIDNFQNKAIINALLTAQIDNPIRFIATKDEEGYSKVFPMQFNKGLKWFSTKDNPQGVPQPVKKTVAGETKWNWDDQDEWYFNKFQELSEKVKSFLPTKERVEEKETTVEDFPDNEELKEDVNPDDIPF